jgi:hypothetical protein
MTHEHLDLIYQLIPDNGGKKECKSHLLEDAEHDNKIRKDLLYRPVKELVERVIGMSKFSLKDKDLNLFLAQPKP